MVGEIGKTIHIRFRTIIEVLGKPKEHVESSIKEYAGYIKEDKDLVVINDNFAECVEKDGFWVQFVEMEIVSKGIQKLVSFCFEFMPSSIEIIKPDTLTMSNSELSGFFNDLQARLHNVDMVAKQLRNENTFLKRNFKILLQNNISLVLKLESMTIEQIASVTGVEKNELAEFIDNLIKENKIKKEGESYSLVKDEQRKEES